MPASAQPILALSPRARDCGCVALGACGGALLRYGVSEVGKARGQGPASIMCVNIMGSFLLGVVANCAGPQATLLIGTGFCGAFTTFSTYSVDTVKFLNAGNIGAAAALVIGSNALSVGAAAAGFKVSPAVRAAWVVLERSPGA